MDLIERLNDLLQQSERIWEEASEEESQKAQDQFDQLFEQLQSSLDPASSACTA